jgi:hypothetical protein
MRSLVILHIITIHASANLPLEYGKFAMSKPTKATTPTKDAAVQRNELPAPGVPACKLEKIKQKKKRKPKQHDRKIRPQESAQSPLPNSKMPVGRLVNQSSLL